VTTFHGNLEIEHELDELISETERRLELYKALRRVRDEHYPAKWRFVKGSKKRIARVECSCKHVTEYKVPLASIEDFECPKKGKL